VALLSEAEIEAMQADVELVISANPTSVALRRGDADIDAQDVLLASAKSSGREVRSDVGEEMRQRVLILGTVSLDIARDDRFNVGGRLYRVTKVKPDYPTCIQAEAEAVD
jgi:hypothetical protein